MSVASDVTTAHRSSTVSRRRTAVVIGRGGAAGSIQTLATLQSVVQEWEGRGGTWDVELVIPRDGSTESLVGCLDGDLTVHYDVLDVSSVLSAVRARGSEPAVLVAGDSASVGGGASSSTRIRVPLVDEQGIDPWTGDRLASLSNFHPGADGLGTLTWERDFDPAVKHPVVVFTNLSVARAAAYRAHTKVAWLIESPEVYSEATAFVTANPNLFDLVITSDAQLARSLPRAVTVPLAGCWVPPEDQRLAEKTRDVSMVASGKGFTSGHRMRHHVIPHLQGVDLYGRGLHGVPNLGEVRNKADALLPYRYSIAVENTWTDDFFSEKIIDCFRTGTIPIWWGTSAVLKHFNPDGILTFKTLEELQAALRTATPEHYAESLDAVRDNYERARAWRVVEDRIQPHLLPYL